MVVRSSKKALKVSKKPENSDFEKSIKYEMEVPSFAFPLSAAAECNANRQTNIIVEC